MLTIAIAVLLVISIIVITPSVLRLVIKQLLKKIESSLKELEESIVTSEKLLETTKDMVVLTNKYRTIIGHLYPEAEENYIAMEVSLQRLLQLRKKGQDIRSNLLYYQSLLR